jgi:hypothetical protein
MLLVAGLVLALSATGALAAAVSSGSLLGLVLGEAVVLVSLGAFRIFFAIAIGPLRRRRAFEPDRVREAPAGSLVWAYLLALVAAALVAATTLRATLDFLDVGHKHNALNTTAYAWWVAAALVGLVAAAIAFRLSRDGAVRASWGIGSRVERLTAFALLGVNRFVIAPSVGIAAGTSEWIPSRDDALGRSTVVTGRLFLTITRWPVLPALILLAVLLAAVVAFVSPGVFR